YGPLAPPRPDHRPHALDALRADQGLSATSLGRFGPSRPAYTRSGGDRAGAHIARALHARGGSALPLGLPRLRGLAAAPERPGAAGDDALVGTDPQRAPRAAGRRPRPHALAAPPRGHRRSAGCGPDLNDAGLLRLVGTLHATHGAAAPAGARLRVGPRARRRWAQLLGPGGADLGRPEPDPC